MLERSPGTDECGGQQGHPIPKWLNCRRHFSGHSGKITIYQLWGDTRPGNSWWIQEKDYQLRLWKGKALWCMKMVKIQPWDTGEVNKEWASLSFKKKRFWSADPVIPVDGYKWQSPPARWSLCRGIELELQPASKRNGALDKWNKSCKVCLTVLLVHFATK